MNRDGILEPTLPTEAAFNGPVTGLAFSPVDFNLWHPTERRRNDPGHGVTTPFDNSRDPSVARRVTGSIKKDGQADDVRENFESQGGLSFYFGLENSVRDPQLTHTYLQYTYDIEDPVFEAIPRLPGGPTYTDAQYGIVDAFSHHDLAVRAGGNNYNLPGGAKGSLVTGEFSLEGYSATDKPTLYFNYFLNTENQSNDPAQDRLINEMRDAVRVFVSADGGITWSMLASNNAYRDINVPRSELPSFASASSNIDSTGTRDPRQRIQELFDTTDGSNEWRQARIDLGEFAGQKNLQLRFDFSTAGAMNANRPGDNVPDLPGDEFGNLLSEDRFQNNNFEGWFIDDVMIGFAERGEIVTGSQANSNFFSVPNNPNPAAPQETLDGRLSVGDPRRDRIRRQHRGMASPIIVGPSVAFPNGRIYDTNDRMSESFTLIAPGGTGVVDGQTFQINDGDTTLTFEFESGGGVVAGNSRSSSTRSTRPRKWPDRFATPSMPLRSMSAPRRLPRATRWRSSAPRESSSPKRPRT